jgi:DNA-binding NtrC family response regulator
MNTFNILLTYDDPHMLTVIGWTLKDKGCDVTTARSPEDAIQALESRDYDAVLIDLVMNGSSGHSLMKRTKEISPETMVILLSCEEQRDAEDELFLEADEFVLKPCSRGKLWKRVSGCLERLRLKRKIIACEKKIEALGASGGT